MENNETKTIAEQKLSRDLKTNTVNLRVILSNTEDLTIKYARAAGCDICVITCEGMTDAGTIANLIYRPLSEFSHTEMDAAEFMQNLQSNWLIAVDQGQVETYDDIVKRFMSGYAVILADGVDYGTAIGVQGYKTRSVEKPSTHMNFRSSNEAFAEVVRTNVSLVRRRLKSPDFVNKIVTVGERSQTDVAICYLKEKADPVLVQQVEEKLKQVPVNMILEGGYLEPFLQDDNWLFSQVGYTDRPDKFAAKLYDGRVGLIVDGTPNALYLPLLFSENFHVIDDYTNVPIYSTVIRWLKYLAFSLTVLLPGFYIAIANFNPELFPALLLFNLMGSIKETPYAIFTECVLIHIVYEIMREGGLRLPTVSGQVVSIVGGLVMGEIVISVGLVGAPIVLIVAIGSVSSFVIPDLYPMIIILRFAFMFAGGFYGLFGITVLGLILLLKVCSMSNFGTPLTAPFVPFTFGAMRDFFIRASWRKLAQRDIPISRLNGSERIKK